MRELGDGWWWALLDATQDAVVAIDDRACIILFNRSAEQIFGWAHDEVIGQRVNMLMAEPYATQHDDYLAHYEATGERRAIGRIRTVSARRRSGETFPIELSVTELPGSAKVRYAALIRDISEKARLQRELMERERLAAVGMASAKFAHEVGNPINSIAMQVQLMQRRMQKQDAPDPRLVEQVDTILEVLTRLQHLLDEFRSLSRRGSYQRVPTDLAELVRRVCLAQEALHSELRIRVHQRLRPVPVVSADPDRLTQVLLNVCMNASEAMPGGGDIWVDVEPGAGETVRLRIADSGAGVPRELDVFEPFVSGKAGSAGLGLAICRQIVDEHGGTIEHAPREGGGTVITIELPLDGRARDRVA
jgi:two-component system sensor kinase FixL